MYTLAGSDLLSSLKTPMFFDPGAREPAVLCWFEFNPDREPYFTMHEIDNDSGSGLNIVAEDLTGDNAIDIAISNKKGVFVFERIAERLRFFG